MTRRAAAAAALLAAAMLGVGRADARAAALVVEGGEIHTVSGPVIENGLVLIEQGRIVEVGPAGEIDVPDDARRLSAQVVTPGLIDAHTSVGLAGMYNVDADRDANETTGPNQADLRAIDAFNPTEPLLRFLLEHGVTLVHTGPGPANPIGGQAGVFRTFGTVADQMMVRFPSALVLSLGERPKQLYGERNQRPTTRMGTAALIREALAGGLDYARKRAEEKEGNRDDDEEQPPERDLRREVLARTAQGELRALFEAHRADDILTALRLVDEFELDAVIAGASEGYLVADELAAAGVPVLVGPVMQRVGRPETENATYENAALLAGRGIPIAIRSGYEPYVPRARVILFEAAIAAANGLGPERALRAITLDPARILGLDEDYGSIQPGKVADLVLFDGDPFEYATHVQTVLSAGVPVHTRR